MSHELTSGKKYQSKSHSVNTPLSINRNIYMAKVISIEDELNVGRIRVFIDGIDHSNMDLPYAYPLMSRIVHVMPQVGELVLVFFADIKKEKQTQKFSNRFWIGPIISNYENLNYDTQDLASLDMTNFLITYSNLSDPLQTKSKNNKNNERGIFPVDDQVPPLPNNLREVSMIGRNNTDIVQSDNKIKIRAGKHKKNKPVEPNNNNPVYSVYELINDDLSYSLTAGDEIYLISHKGRFRFKKTLTNDDINDLKQNAQSMLYGELTVDYLRTLTNAFINHIHQHPQKQPIKDTFVTDLEKKLSQIEELLAKNIKIN